MNGLLGSTPSTGWGLLREGSDQCGWLAYLTGNNIANASLTLPIVLDDASNNMYLGSLRLPNAVPFHQYLNDRFYDRHFYAPLDDPVHHTEAQTASTLSLRSEEGLEGPL